MSFNCSIFLEDIDINCNAKNKGGIKKVVLGLQRDLTVNLDPSDETLVTNVELARSVNFEHNNRDAATTFNESKTNNNGLGVVTTDIIVRLPMLDRKLNKLDYMSRRNDIVAIVYYNNDTAMVCGWMDGLTMNYNATSNTRPTELSYVDVTLTTESWISSLSVEDTSIIQLP